MRKTPFLAGNYYHLYNRGVDKRIIFIEDSDYLRFMSLLYLCNNTKSLHYYRRKKLDYCEYLNIERENTLINIGAYCLMPNHIHILAAEKNDGNISKFMQKITTAYTMYFNTKYERTGSLFENTFKSKLADSDIYLKYLFSYIHLNPLKIIDPTWKDGGLKNYKEAEVFINSYRYSSILDYCGKMRPESTILTKTAFPDYFSTQVEFKASIHDYCNLAPRFSLGA